MKKLLQLASILFFSLAAQAQNENNIWCFGYGAALDFNSGSPVAITSAIGTTEGCSSIADASGNLLFYTDGLNVWNNTHVTMPNGFGLNGGGSSTQSALIVLQPGSTTIYYIFTTAEAQGAAGFCYSIVDMTLQAGLGDVTTKNVQLFTPSPEKVCGTFHANGTDIWVVGHELGTDVFHSYLLTAAGLNAVPVLSTSGDVHSLTSGAEIGYMKISSDGSKLALAIRYQYENQLCDFDNATGMVSNPITIPSTGGVNCYGVEFSPDNAKLYLADDSQTSQYDITSNNSTTINNSKTYVGGSIWALQLATDGKIYAAEYTSSALSVINAPDSAGASCNYQSMAVPLIGSSALGLPNMIAKAPNILPVAIFSSPNHICPGTCTNFTNHSLHGVSYLWTFTGANPSVSTDVDPTNICYNTPGTYSVSLIATNATGSDTLTLNNYITVYPYPAPQGIAQNGDTLFANQGAVSYQWYHTGVLIPGATDYFYVADASGDFNVVATDANGCEVEAAIFDVVAGVQSDVSALKFEVYPNPVNEELEIRNLKLGAGATISIYNVLGKQVLDFQTSGIQHAISLNVSALSSGMYCLEVSSSETIFHTKFVKQ